MSTNVYDRPSAAGPTRSAGRITEGVVRHPVEFTDETAIRTPVARSATEVLGRLRVRIASERSRLDGFTDLRSDAVRAYEARLDWITERETMLRSHLDDLLPLLPTAEAEASAEEAQNRAEVAEARLHELTEADRTEAERLAAIAETEAELEAQRAQASVLEADAAALREALAVLPDDDEEP